MVVTDLKDFGKYLTPLDLVSLGIYSNVAALYSARKQGFGPKYIKIGRKSLYPKDEVEDFIKSLIVDNKKNHSQSSNNAIKHEQLMIASSINEMYFPSSVRLSFTNNEDIAKYKKVSIYVRGITHKHFSYPQILKHIYDEYYNNLIKENKIS